MLRVTVHFFFPPPLRKTEDKKLTIYFLPSRKSCSVGCAERPIMRCLTTEQLHSHGLNIYQWLCLKVKGSPQEVVQPEISSGVGKHILKALPTCLSPSSPCKHRFTGAVAVIVISSSP